MRIKQTNVFNNNSGLIVPIFVFYMGLFFYPLIRVLLFSVFDPAFTLKYYYKFFQTSIYMHVFLLTFKLGLIVTAVCIVLGYPVAYLLANAPRRVQGPLMICVIISFWTSLLVRTYAWMVILQRKGLLNTFLLKIGIIDKPIKLIYNTFGVSLGMINILLPFMILTLYGVMKGIDKNLLKASQNLGANPFQSFLRVYFPLSMPGVTGGALLVFVIAIGFYITPSLMGGLKDITVSLLIENEIRKLLNWGYASTLSVILLVITLGFIYIYNHFLGLDRLLGGEKKIR